MSEVAISAGQPQRMNFNMPTEQVAESAADNTAEGAVDDTEQSGGKPNTEGSNPIEKPSFTDEDFQAFLKERGIEGTFDDVKAKFQPQGTELTPEEIAAKETAMERRMLDMFLKGGGKVEDFTAVKQMLSADVAEVSKAQLHQELLTQGFDEDEAKAMAKQMFLQEDLENIEIGDDETEAEFDKRKAQLEKKVQYGADKLANRSLHIKTTAEQIWSNLKKEVELEDSDAAREVTFSTEVDEVVKTLPKSISLSIGKVDNKDIDPIAYNVPEEIHQEVSALLKDKQKREEFFFDAKGNLNLQNLTDLLVRNKVLESASRETYIKGGTAQVKVFEQMFPARSAQALGVGGNNGKPKTDKGAVASTGQPQRIRPQYT